jgi:hypothetical protein
MLVQKKISTKKLAVYISIIFFMISGAGFMLYQNKKLAVRKLKNINAPIVFNNSAFVAPVAVDNKTGAEPTQNLDMSKINQSGSLDLNIFSSDKFKDLRANTFFIKEQPEMGKRDPFKPN